MNTIAPDRLKSLDQFRGYTVAGMFFVNFLNHHHAIHPVFFHHNTYCSYADTIMPQFFFAVGFAYRMTHLKRVERDGVREARRHAVWRNVTLAILAIIWYGFTQKSYSWTSLANLGVMGFFTEYWYIHIWQTLMHIACASIWVLPVIGANLRTRVAYLLFSALLYLAICHAFYFDWVHAHRGIDGGPLAFFSWAIPILAGTVAYDFVKSHRSHQAIPRLLMAGALMMALGYAISCLNAVAQSGPAASGCARWLVEPPFVPPSRPIDVWTMSQRTASVSYLTFASGFSLAVMAFFVWIADVHGLEWGFFRTLGQNALAGYLLHEVIAARFVPFAPVDAPLTYLLALIAVYLFVNWLVMHWMEKRGLYVRL